MLLTTLGLVALASASGQSSQDTSGAAAIEDVEIMRRLLVEAIDDANKSSVNVQLGELSPDSTPYFGQGFLGGTTLTTLLGSSGSVSHSRGFKAPRVGVLFSLDVQVAAKEVEKKAEEEGEQRPDDEWERIKREVATGKPERPGADPMTAGGTLLDTFRRAQTRAWTLDSTAIDSVVDAVLATLAHHGARIRDLDADETITVALHLYAQQGVSVPYQIALGDGEPAPEKAGWTRLLSTYGSAYAPPQRVVIQVRAGDLSTSANGGGLDRLKRTAMIYRY